MEGGSAGVKYKSRNVLVDQELRDGIKSFSNWPTVPQVYVAGEFVGGSDILISMHRSGELQEMLKGLQKES
jgi:monothiol glutaredoxin